MLARVRTATLLGMTAGPVEAEVEARGGEGRIAIIGLGDAAVRESRDRILAALEHSGFRVPSRILINLSPAELKKEGAHFDLPIALGILVAAGVMPPEATRDRWFFGELSLDGSLKPVRGIVPLAAAACRAGCAEIYVPIENGDEASLIPEAEVVGCASLGETVQFLRGSAPQRFWQREARVARSVRGPSLAEVRGQGRAKRALTLAAAGGHHLLFVGPPGCGKSMLAERFTTLLPPLNPAEQLEVVAVHSLAGQPLERLLDGERPLRKPHYHMSEAGMLGAGAGSLRPGELALAHRGVLFLDELPEFRRPVLESLRTPLETGEVHLAKARGQLSYRAAVQLLAAMNPCPCGRLSVPGQVCRCSPHQIERYVSRISQPLLERIDLQVELQPISLDQLAAPHEEDEAAASAMKQSVSSARAAQMDRQGKLNCVLTPRELRNVAPLDDGVVKILEDAHRKLGLSARSYSKILRVARTAADLEAESAVAARHVAEALGFRGLRRGAG